ncbi:TatD DNase family protein [Anoxybacillus pushchinoensis]|uniref:TatD DNase family protein n=1 Tax=Anoxybacillus pushchinoensis TaxID=150248 RepID=A0A1I0U3Q3_9BACL|nr:TatD family hydrolase [Anoxybacillus pushchinoensis]SFA58570.1 TatD DNase family protein [Anoxybacillus pushchinoensis]
MPSLVDFHIHIDYYKNYEEMYSYFAQNKIYALFVTNLPEIYDKCKKLFPKSKYVRIAMGYNPQIAKTHRFNKTLFEKWLPHTKYIGEVGLDYSKEYFDYRMEQQRVFRYICKRAGEHNKILSIHSRMAERDVLNILKESNVRFAVFHWYSGPLSLVDEIIRNGYYFSVNYSMLTAEKGLKIIEKIPLERLLIETDGPFGKGSIASYNLQFIYDEFAKVLGIKDIKGVVFNNLKTLLNNQKRYEQ